MAIDRASVSPGIVRTLRDGWRTINCAVFVTDERSALSLCSTEGRTNLVAVRIRCVSVMRTHPHMYPRSSAPLDVWSEKYVRDTVLFRRLQCENILNISQVMISQTLVCKIHTIRHKNSL